MQLILLFQGTSRCITKICLEDLFKRETFKIHERSVSHRNCEQLYKTQKNPEETPLAKCMLKMDMEEMENLKKLFITPHIIAYWNKAIGLQ